MNSGRTSQSTSTSIAIIRRCQYLCSLLTAEFVVNECNEVISPPYHSVWTIGQDRADYKWNNSAEEEERALQEMIPAAIAGIARSCVVSLPNTAYYYTHQRYAGQEALTDSNRRLRLLRRILCSVIRSRERVRCYFEQLT